MRLTPLFAPAYVQTGDSGQQPNFPSTHIGEGDMTFSAAHRQAHDHRHALTDSEELLSDASLNSPNYSQTY